MVPTNLQRATADGMLGGVLRVFLTVEVPDAVVGLSGVWRSSVSSRCCSWSVIQGGG